MRRAEQGTGSPATAAEMMQFTARKLQAIERAKNVHNPLALLATVVPKCFEGESFRVFRETQARREAEERERLAAQQRETVEMAQAVMDDPAATESEREWARAVLGEA